MGHPYICVGGDADEGYDREISEYIYIYTHS